MGNAWESFVFVMGNGFEIDAILTTLMVAAIVLGNAYFWLEPVVEKMRAKKATSAMLTTESESDCQPDNPDDAHNDRQSTADAGYADGSRTILPGTDTPTAEGQLTTRSSAEAAATDKHDIEPIVSKDGDAKPDVQNVALEIKVDPAMPRRPRLLYLDNLRSFLTVVVILHHIICVWLVLRPWFEYGSILYVETAWFATGGIILSINQSYFMSLFFFLSAYFVPTSFDRKGAAVFLRDRLRRLGLPLLISGFVLVPFLVWFVQDGPPGLARIYLLVGQQAAPYQYQWRLEHMWFVMWLLLFNVAYSLIALDTKGQQPVAIRLPSFTGILALGAALGLIHGAISCIPRSATWWWNGTMNMPFFPMYITWFTLGVVAKRNDWLHQLHQWDVRRKRIAHTFTAIALVLTIIFYMFMSPLAVFPDEPGWEFLKIESDLEQYLLFSTVTVGLLCVTMIVSMLLLFGDFVNFSNRFCRFLADSSYTAYIVHGWIIIPFAYSFMKILAAAGQPLWEGFFIVSKESLTSYWLVFAGGVYTTFLSFPVLFGVSWPLCKAPGLNQIL